MMSWPARRWESDRWGLREAQGCRRCLPPPLRWQALGWMILSLSSQTGDSAVPAAVPVLATWHLRRARRKQDDQIMRAGKALLEAMKQEGVEVVFGYPGGSVIPLFDDLYDSSLLQILPRHEQGGAHAADGYARASGKVGVVIVTSGPGATNVVTGIANAYLDSVPLVVITGQVKTHLIGTD